MIRYAISDPKYYSQNPLTFKKRYLKALRKNPTFFLLRDKENPNLFPLAKGLKNLGVSFLVSRDLKLARRLNLFGVHLTSTQLEQIPKVRRSGFFVAVSTHSLKEVKKAQHLRADLILFSPIFPTPNKPPPKGVKELRRVAQKVKTPLLALGGVIGKKEINKIKNRASGFASIRYFITNSTLS